jgi:hypothetical protein
MTSYGSQEYHLEMHPSTRTVPKWQLYVWLVFFISCLIGIVYLYIWADSHKSHKMDCGPARDLLGHYLAAAVIDDAQGVTAQYNIDQQAALKVILTTPYCFPQSLIETAQQNYNM